MEKKERTHFQEPTTPRAAQGFNFTAKGGKRQGHKLPQSLKTKRFGKPDHSTAFNTFSTIR
jgi:hypothetical protein